jgi:ankyrin repeat protein
MPAVRALLRNGANIATATVAPSLGTCPVSQPTGSTALHMAAAAEDIGMARILLEAQVRGFSGGERGGANNLSCGIVARETSAI